MHSLASPALPRRMRALGLAALGLALAPIAAILLARALQPPPPPLPVLEELPAFTLTDQDGKPSGLAQLQGQVWVADFVFTRCPSICPLLTAKMAELQKRSAEKAPALQLVSISVDPDFDTPQVLTRYMKAHGADPSRWRFLTGTTDAIQQVVTTGFKEVLERDHAKGPEDFLSIVHGGHLVLVDRHGRIRGYYDSHEPDAVERVLQDSAQLLGER